VVLVLKPVDEILLALAEKSVEVNPSSPVLKVTVADGVNGAGVEQVCANRFKEVAKRKVIKVKILLMTNSLGLIDSVLSSNKKPVWVLKIVWKKDKRSLRRELIRLQT
jgi:hypothetical protein